MANDKISVQSEETDHAAKSGHGVHNELNTNIEKFLEQSDVVDGEDSE